MRTKWWYYKLLYWILFSSPTLILTAHCRTLFATGTGPSKTSMILEIIYKSLYYNLCEAGLRQIWHPFFLKWHCVNTPLWYWVNCPVLDPTLCLSQHERQPFCNILPWVKSISLAAKQPLYCNRKLVEIWVFPEEEEIIQASLPYCTHWYHWSDL